jgi:hypothetical protein
MRAFTSGKGKMDCPWELEEVRHKPILLRNYSDGEPNAAIGKSSRIILLLGYRWMMDMDFRINRRLIWDG